MFETATLERDVVDARGALVAPRGTVVSPASIREAAARAPRLSRRALADTFLAHDLHAAVAGEAHPWLFRGPAAEAGTLRVLRAVALPGALFDELSAVKLADPPRYAHALATAALTARALLLVEGEGPGLADAAAAALLHDLALRQLPVRIRQSAEALDAEEAREVAAHTLVGALHLARLLGPHPAVDTALGHHARPVQGYPVLGQAPAPLVGLVSVASAFSALTAPRPFRSGPYDSRAAVDLLARELRQAGADLTPLRWLVHALRGGEGRWQDVELSGARKGRAPEQNRYRGVAAALR